MKNIYICIITYLNKRILLIVQSFIDTDYISYRVGQYINTTVLKFNCVFINVFIYAFTFTYSNTVFKYFKNKYLLHISLTVRR